MYNKENLFRLFLNKKNRVTKTRKLNKDKRWIFENNRGLLFIYNSNNRKLPVRNSNVAYRNNGKRIVAIRPEYTYHYGIKSGGYRVPPRRAHGRSRLV